MLEQALECEKGENFEQALTMLALIKGRAEEAKEHRKRILVAMKTKEDKLDWLEKGKKAVDALDYGEARKLLVRKAYDDEL